MTDEQIRRYARHILLPDVGGRGQERLLASTCTVTVGPGRAADSCALLYLVAAGVGTIGLVGDLEGPVTSDEQHEQPIYTCADVGRPRGATLVARLAALNPDVRVVPAVTLDASAVSVTMAASPAWLDARTPPVAAALVDGSLAACQLLAILARA